MCSISFNQKENEYLVRLEGRIDSDNSPNVEQAIDQAIPQGEKRKVTMDLLKLEYISSAGLRAILKAKKNYHDVKLVNVQPVVYEVFETTGFTAMMPIAKVLREISLEGCEQIGYGMTGLVYRMDIDTVVKVFYPEISKETAERERNSAKIAFTCGFPTAISFELATCNGCYAIIFEQLKAKTVSELINANPEKVEEYGIRMGRLLKEIHSLKTEDERLNDIKALYIERSRKMREWLTEDETAVLVGLYESLPDTGTMLHGDFHSKNIMEQNDELLMIDMGDVGYGHPLLDWAGVYLTHIAINIQEPNGTLKTIGLEKEKADIIWRKMLETYFNTTDDDVIDRKVKLIRLYGMAKSSLVPVLAPNFPEQYKEKVIEVTRETVIPMIRQYNMEIDF